MIDLKDPLDPTDPLLDPERNRHVLAAALQAPEPRRARLRPALAGATCVAALGVAAVVVVPGGGLSAQAALAQAAQQLEDVTSGRVVVRNDHALTTGYGARSSTVTRFDGERFAMRQELDETFPDRGERSTVTDYVEVDGQQYLRDPETGGWRVLGETAERGGTVEGRRVTEELRDGRLLDLMRRSENAERDGDTIRATLTLAEIGNGLPSVLRGPIGVNPAIPPSARPEGRVELRATLDGELLRAVELRLTTPELTAHQRVEYLELGEPQEIEAP